MGVLKFRVTPPDAAVPLPDVRQAYVTGIDRTPARTSTELRDGILMCRRETSESGRVHVPWPVEGFGQLVVATATLAERPAPYDLAVELARGKLNELQNQLADWRQMGLSVPSRVEERLHEARKACATAVTSRESPSESSSAAAKSLVASCQAARDLVASYTEQLLKRRLEHSSPLPTMIACGLDGLTKTSAWAPSLATSIHAGQVRMAWSSISPDEGKQRWEESDAQIAWCRKNHLLATAGPLVEFHRGALPDWLWLWQGDYEEIQTQATDHVRQTITRYRGKVSTWHVVHRMASNDILGLSEEEQIRLTAHLIQVAKRLDPDAHIVVDFDRPWGEWMASSRFQLGPLHLADSLARAEIGLGGIGLEVAPGFADMGSHLRDLLDFSRLLDLFALVSLPLHISLAFPSAPTKDGKGDVTGEASRQWPRPPDESLQVEMMESWFSLATSKPFVKSVTWMHATDAACPIFQSSGLFRSDGTAKPSLAWLKKFRDRITGGRAAKTLTSIVASTFPFEACWFTFKRSRRSEWMHPQSLRGRSWSQEDPSQSIDGWFASGWESSCSRPSQARARICLADWIRRSTRRW